MGRCQWCHVAEVGQDTAIPAAAVRRGLRDKLSTVNADPARKSVSCGSGAECAHERRDASQRTTTHSPSAVGEASCRHCGDLRWSFHSGAAGISRGTERASDRLDRRGNAGGNVGAGALGSPGRLRTRTTFSATGVIDFGVLHAVSRPWDRVTNCNVVEKTLQAAKGARIHGVLLRFTGQYAGSSDSTVEPRRRCGVIELFVPDAVPLAPDIVALLKTIPQLSQAPWHLLEPSLLRQARAPHRNP